jgi:branched-chain amino acid transport system permease protein
MDTLRDLYLTYQSLVGYIGINTLLALSVYATLSAGQLSLANAGFMAIGAYTGALLTLRAALPFPIVLAAATLAPAVLAVPLGLPVLRLRGVFLAIATIGFGEVVRLFFVNWSYANGAMGIDAIPQKTSLVLIWVLVAFALFLFARLRGSRAGLALEAIRQDETAARSLGIDTTARKLAVFVLGAGLAGLAGALEAHLTYTVTPSGFGFGRVVEMLVQAVVGGTAVYYGPLLGALFLTSLPEILRELGARAGIEPGAFRPMLNGVVLLVVILFLPNGLASLPSRWRARRSRRAGP